MDAVDFAQSLIGRELRTLRGRPNTILRVDGEVAIVATGRSPAGTAVPLVWLDDALARLQRDGEIEISVESVGYRSAFIGAALRELPGATVLPTSPPRLRLSARLPLNP